MLTAMLGVMERQAEWIVALGRKSACERICALLCDIHDRLAASGRARDGRFALPLTQSDMADVVGLTPVHVNRVLRDLRSQGVIALDGRTLRVVRADALREVAAGTVRQAATAPVRREAVPALEHDDIGLTNVIML